MYFTSAFNQETTTDPTSASISARDIERMPNILQSGAVSVAEITE